ncbi:GFA family protein [Paraburkholderia caffeinitolerans]
MSADNARATLRGQCLCGAVRYRVDDAFGYAFNCHCGSLLYSVVREGAFAHVTMGTLVDTPSIRPQGHIFVGSKAPWHEIADTLPQYGEFPP